MSSTVPVITIDGPSGVGKSTLCKLMCEKLQWHILDSGAIYRALALLAINYNIDLNSEKVLASLAINLDVSLISTNGQLQIYLRGENVSNKIRNQKVSNIASQIAVFPLVREALLNFQRLYREAPGLVADGRDMSTLVFPDAKVKIFLDASLESRTNRRMLQLQRRGFNINFKSILSDMKERDNRDCNRIIAPLIPDESALILDSTNLTIEQVLKKALQYTYDKLNLHNLVI